MAYYFCPHREPKNLSPGETPCPCATPAPGMLWEAAEDFRLDLSKSFIVGDKLSDIAAGRAAGCTAVLVRTGKGGRDDGEGIVATPDWLASDLFDAATHIRQLLSQRRPARRNLEA